MGRLRGTFNPITVLLLAIVNLVTLSSCQNLYTFPTTIGSTGSIDKHIDYHWSTPSNTTISISQETTSYLAAPTTVQPREILDIAETGFPNRHGKSSHYHEKEDNDPEEPEDHVIPYSVHEDARDVSTQPKYVAPGLWAKPPSDKNISLDFVPTKLHAQVRGTHTVKRLPQREAIKSAKTDEEKQNAHRLREVVTNSKVNTIYTEEGYEDSAYDHAGHIRDADFHEGFARKLHNQKNDKNSSQSGKKKKGREKQHNLVSDELREYDEDYQDYLDRSVEREKSSDDEHNLINKNGEGSEIDPKLVVANGLQELEKDVEEDVEEAERSEIAYQRQQESRPLVEDDVDVDSSESEETHDEGDLKDEENKPVISKKSKFQKEKIDTLDKKAKTSRKSKQKKRLREGSHETTILPVDDERSSEVDSETPANPHGFVTNPLNSETYSIDQTTFKYFTPVPLTDFQQFDEPTTINYGKLFWDYFKVSQTPPTIEPVALIPNSTTSNPQLEEQTPVAVVTIDSHVPYLLVTKEETSTLPSTFFGTRDFHPQRLFSDHMDLEPSSIQEQGRHLPGQSDVNYIDSVVATSTVATFSNVQPLLLQPLATSAENTEYSSSTTLLDDVASTPAVKTLNFTKEAYSRMDNYRTNPFLSSILNDSNIAIIRTNKFPYKVLVRPTSKKTAKPTQPSYKQKPLSIILQQEDKNKRIRENPSDKYNKIVDYIKSKQKIKSLTESKKLVFPEDLTLMKPPIPHQRAVYPSFLINHPIAEHSNVFVESESPREANNWRGVSREQYRSQPATDQSYRLNPFIFLHPLQLTYSRNLLPVTKLLPPPPLPLPPPITSAHITYQNGRQHNDYLSHILGKSPQQQPRSNTLRLFPLTPEIGWRSRRRRSSEDTTSETSLVVGGNDENAQKKRHISQSKTRENSKESVTNSKSHEELLNESPKISEDVIDREIATRFDETERVDETESTDETSTESKGEKNVEVEVPSFDYIEKFTKDNQRIEEIPFTITESHIDTKKYPFYNNKNLPSASALKYAVDPRTIPRKTSRGMEFYDSRNTYKQCDEVGADLGQVLPEKEEPDPKRDVEENLPRLRGLGDKLDCFKAKYFDENPLDNPLFAEESVEQPELPAELDPIKFASKVLLLPQENDDYVMHRVSKKPERQSRQWRRRNPQYEKHESIRVNYKHDPKTGRGRNAYLHTIRGSKLPNGAVHRTKNRGPKPKSPTSTPTPKTEQQTESYQKQVYEDVMGNIRNMANDYQIHKMTTLPPATQIQTAGSEDAPKIAEDTPNLSAEKNTTDIANVTSSTSMSSEIKGLMPPPKFLIPRRLANYRKYRPLGKNRITLLRAPGLPHIIAHHHTIKISKRSAAAVNFSKDTSDKNKKKTVRGAVKAVNGNNTVTKTTASSTNSTRAILDSEIEESRPVGSQDQSPLSSTLKVGKRRQTNSTSDDVKNAATSQRMVYTIRDRIRHSKPKWDTAGFDKFSSSPKTPDVDSRRKEPRYNYLARNKLVDDTRVKSTTSSTIDSNTLAIAPSLTESRKSGTTETHRPQDFIVHQSVYGKNIEYPEVEEAESINDAKSEESSEEESEKDNEEKEGEEEKEEKEGEETENTTKTYHVHEDVDEDVPATTAKLPSWNSLNSEEILIKKYLETDPPGYTEAFSEEIKPSNKNLANTKNKLEDSDEKQDEETDHSKSIADSREDDSSEKAKERVKMLVKKKKEKGDNESSEESSSTEEEGSKNDQTFFTYTTRPSWVESDKDAENSKKTSYRSFPFTRYKSMIKKESSEDEDPEDEDSEEESKEVEHTFPWNGDKEEDTSKRLKAANRFEYPWERRERLAKERRKRRQERKRMRKLYFGDEDEDEDEEEPKRRPLYPWEKYNVRSKDHADTRRDVLPQNTNNSEEESSNEELALKKFSSRYSAADMQSTIRPTNAREIRKSIMKLLNNDSDESEEEVSKEIEYHYASPTQKLPATIRAISRGRLVPEDVTQPPRRKSRRKTPRYDKNITSSSRFDSKNFRNKDSEEGEEKEELRKDYLKLDGDNSESSESQAEVENSQLSDIMKKASSSISAPRKKRRRIIPKNNSTFFFDNAFAESSTKATKRRRKKLQVSSTPATPPANTDLKTSKLDFAHLRKRYWTAGDVVNTNKPNSTEVIPSSTAGTTKADSAETETSTPKTRTIEHRSRVSKEKIVMKTTYPDETGNFDVARKNETFTRQEPVKKLKIKISPEKTDDKQRNNGNEDSNVHEEPIKRKDEGEYYDIRLKEDNIGKLTTSEKPEVKKNENSLRKLGLKKKDVKKINDFNAFDGIVNDEDDDNRFGDMIPLETHAVNYLLRNIPPRRRKDQVKTTIENNATRINEKLNEQISNKKGENTAAKQKPFLQAKFIKDPDHRLYYYVESK